MKPFVLAVVLIALGGPVLAAEPASRTVPPIPGPDQAMEPIAPLDEPWPVAPAAPGSVSPDRVVPVVPAPAFARVTPEAQPVAKAAPQPAAPVAKTGRAARGSNAIPPIPSPDQPMTPISPLDEPWDMTAEVDPRNIPPIPALSIRSFAVAGQTPATQPPAKPAPGGSSASGSFASGSGTASAPATAAAPVTPTAPATSIASFDPEGTVHTVATGDTLWDISNLYLGTPWIWPSIWQDNEAVENPHLIFPGDRIWVSATEMRKLTDAEAEALLAREPQSAPAAMAEDLLAVPMPEKPRQTLYYVRNASLGLVSEKELEGLGQVVGTPEEQVMMAQGDEVFVDLGEGDVTPGDQFTLFRTSQKVHDPSTHDVLGLHSEVVGWLEITEVYPKSSRAKVRQSYIDFVPGVYLKPRIADTLEIPVLDSPLGIEGQIADLMLDPKYRAGGDVVILNRGSEDGLVAGSPVEVYRPIADNWKENWYGDQPDVEIPHEVVADLVVLTSEAHTAMAYVTYSTTELWYGDRFRTVAGPNVQHASRGRLSVEERVVRWVVAQGRKAVDGVADLAGKVPTPETPEAVSRWNMPRLSLPDLEGYDPR